MSDKKKKSFLFSICMSCFFFCCVRCLYSNFFIMKCCCLLKRKSAQNIFVNQWCAINGQVLFLKVLNFLFGMVNYREKKEEEECIILFYSNVTEGESKRQGPHLICETRNEASISNDWFYSALFCFFSFLELHVHIVLWSGEHVFSRRCVLSRPYLSMTLHPS